MGEYRVAAASSVSEHDCVFRLRHDVYVTEMSLPMQSSHSRVCDELDAYSTNLMLQCDEEVVGAVRGTVGKKCPLELEYQCELWTQAIDRLRAETTPAIGEITRLVIDRHHYGGKQIVMLLAAAAAAAHAEEVEALLFAGKPGPELRLCQLFGASVVVEQPQPYYFNRCHVGDCQLWMFDLRRPNALRSRAIVQANFPTPSQIFFPGFGLDKPRID